MINTFHPIEPIKNKKPANFSDDQRFSAANYEIISVDANGFPLGWRYVSKAREATKIVLDSSGNIPQADKPSDVD